MRRAHASRALARLFGLLLVSLVGSLPLAALELKVLCRESPVSSGTVFVTASAAEPAKSKATLAVTVPLNELQHVDFESERSGPWDIRAEVDGCWGPPVVWAAGPEAPNTIIIELEAAGKLDFGINAKQLPDDLAVSFMYPVEDPNRVERFEQACEVTNGRGLCVVPARRLDLRLVAQSYAPVFLWDLEIEPGATLRLGDIELKPGASISGWVVVVGDSDPSAEVSVWSRRVAEPRSTKEIQRRSLAELKVSTDEKGHFVVPGLEVGAYGLSARRNGFSSLSIEAKIDHAGQSVALTETLTLVPQSQLTVDLDPPLDPWRQPWHIQVTRETEEPNVFETVATGAAANHGTWVGPGMDPGQYSLSVVDSQGGTWRSEDVSLLGGPESLFWHIEVVPVRGSVTLGGEPLKADVLFGSGSNAIAFESGEDGLFRGHLPREGAWPVRVEMGTKTGGVRLAVDPVTVRRRSGKSYAEIELELPNTVLEGKVTKNGKPAKALVVALRKQTNSVAERNSGAKRASELVVWSDEEGAFEVLGLSPGPIEIRASDRTAESDWSSIDIVEDQPALVELELAERLTLRGRVVHRDHPVVGAKILVLLDGNLSTSAATGGSGEFRFKLPSYARSGDLIVDPGSSGGIVLASFRVESENDADMLISLPSGSGQLIMGIDPSIPPSPSVRSLADLVAEGMLFYNGAGVSIRQLLDFFPPNGRLFDGGIPLPRVAEGQWLFCPISTTEKKKDCQYFQVYSGSSELISASEGSFESR